MPVNLTLGHVSNDFLIAALVIYSMAVLAFAGDFAFGRPRRAGATAPGAGPGAGRALAAVGAPGATATAPSAADAACPATATRRLAQRPALAPAPVSASARLDARTGRSPLRAIGQAGPWVRAAWRSAWPACSRTRAPWSPGDSPCTGRRGATCTSSSPR